MSAFVCPEITQEEHSNEDNNNIEEGAEREISFGDGKLYFIKNYNPLADWSRAWESVEKISIKSIFLYW